MNVLQEGEVFCQYRNAFEPGDGPTVVTGRCVVMRAPALHLGDVRLVDAVDHPSLRHLVNVIVFPVRGKRPLPNMLAGGDLDGDDYTLIWDRQLLPTDQAEPADYTTPTPVKVNKVTLDNVKDFFVDYIRNDILGQVSNAHLAHADRIGPRTSECTTLAHQASIAVDFPKTGVPAELPSELRPRRWPTFMGKEPSNSYESKRILGLLFDLVQPEPEYQPTDIRVTRMTPDPRLIAYKIPIGILDEAYRLKEDYDVHVTGLMNRYRITEAEVISGIILPNPRRRRGKENDIKVRASLDQLTVKDPVTDNYAVLQRNVLQHAQAYLEKKAFKGSSIRPLQVFAIAAYQVTYTGKGKEAEDRLGRKHADDGMGPAYVYTEDTLMTGR